MNTTSSAAAQDSLFTRLRRHQILIPLAALLLLALFNLIIDPSFFSISLRPNNEGVLLLSGNLISILDYGSELAILALGMTLVTAASGGQDISVGALIAISGSITLRILSGAQSDAMILPAFLITCAAAMLFGAFNGSLVAFFRIQPMIATLILFTAGRSVAAWINHNEQPFVSSERFPYFGGYLPWIPVPTPLFIALFCFLVTWLLLKFTNLGLYVQAVGINEKASRLNGLNPAWIKLSAFVLLGLCAGVAGFIKVSRTASINYSVIANNIEMDAILAVALGGNSLSGGKFNIGASVLGAYVIQFLTTTLFTLNVQSDSVSAYKAVVVIILVVCSAPTVREKLAALLKKPRAPKQAGQSA
ncbi:MAG: ABC transporter permease [Oscillospiraceae bacterium]|nr:ABC transporter permease [Oscillospiraceae bacterium]